MELVRKNVSKKTLEDNIIKAQEAKQILDESIKNNKFVDIKIEDIYSPKYHDRRFIDRNTIVELSESINATGLLYPIVVRIMNGKYERMIGYRRIEAYKILKRETIPAIVLENISEEQAILIMTTENIQREDLSIYDETLAILDYIAVAIGVSQNEVLKLLNRIKNYTSGNTELSLKDRENYNVVEELLKKTGKITINTLVNRLSMLNMQQPIKDELSSGKLSFSCAQALNKIKEEGLLKLAIDQTISQGLSKRETQTLIKALLPKKDNTINIEAINKFKKIKQVYLLKLDETDIKKVEQLIDKIIDIISKN